ncbi:hypothetical protein ACIBSV_47065 [Embleya sp. NPDC050154]|uniref:hypothetical protein n=1 Tax=Embleya sp. NPDC050154 TaxID=3363988 RepID=UPI00378DD12B
MAPTREPMPNRVFRLDTETWDAYAEVCEAKGLSRSDDLRVYIKREVAAHKKRLREQQS